MTEVFIPGSKIGDVNSFQSGSGTYVLADTIYASVVGLKQVVASEDKSQKPTINMVHDKAPSLVPAPNDLVTARVSKISTRMANCDIICVGSTLLTETFPGTIRPRDVQEFDIDNVEIFKSFRPGDIVRATVISLGDSKSYYLSTAKNELGVILAHGPQGNAMVPISWQEMQCPVTKAKELRKVAKVEA